MVACTIVAKPMFAHARVLARAFARQHPDVPFVVLLADRVDGRFDPAREPFHIVELGELGIPHLERLRFRYAQQPLSYASTPYLIRHLLDLGYGRVLFLKQESLVLGSHTPVFDLLARHSIVMTPHLVAPVDGPDGIARELNILQSGAYNVGLLGVSNVPDGRRFVEWWASRTETGCRHAVADGMHYEQRWLNLTPAFFGDMHLLRDPAFNVGHWNLPERVVTTEGGRVFVNGAPAALFRFSGFRPEVPASITRHHDRLSPAAIGPAWQVFERFAAALALEGHFEATTWPYAWAEFDNGVPVPDVARALHAELGDAAARFGDPLVTHGRSFFWWLHSSAKPGAPQGVTRFWEALWHSRLDLQVAFPDPFGINGDAFVAWTRTSGRRELQVPDVFLPERA